MTGFRRDDVVELAPLLRRVVSLESAGLVRLRRGGARLSAMVRLPFGVLAARTVELDEPAEDFDSTVRADELIAWFDGARDEPPVARDEQWRGGLPPASAWRRIDTVPDADVRPLVRSGWLAVQGAAREVVQGAAREVVQGAAREGRAGGPPMAPETAEALLDSVVLTVADGSDSVQVTLRTLSALTRLGFLPRGSHVAVDVSGRWVRLAAAYGSVYAERPGLALTVR
jgi:hypothetical protein